MRWLLLACVALVQAASAQNYPSKPIRFVVGYAPGGAAGLVSRRPVCGEAAGAAGFVRTVVEESTPYPSKPIRFVVGYAPGGAAGLVSRRPVCGEAAGAAGLMRTVVEESTPYPSKPIRFVVGYAPGGAAGLVSRRPVCGEAAGAAGFMRTALQESTPYPSKPIRLIVGYAPGGVTDIVARALSQKLYARFGQQVVVDNRPGGSGTIAAMMTAKAPPDGYTLLMSSVSALATNVSMYSKLPYDPLRDFAPVTLAVATPYLAIVPAGLPASNLREFIALAKAQPGKLNFGSSGAGGGAHLAVELFKSMAGIDLVHVPYKGASLALTDLIGGHIQLTFSQPPVVLPHVRSGKVKALAITSARRLAALPEFPTFAESGLARYEATSWQGVVAPAGTPRAIVSMLQTEIALALRSPDVGARLAAEGSEPGGITPEEFALYIRREIVKWAKVVKDSGVKVE